MSQLNIVNVNVNVTVNDIVIVIASVIVFVNVNVNVIVKASLNVNVTVNDIVSFGNACASVTVTRNECHRVGGQSVVSVHCWAVIRFCFLNEIFGALAANVGTSSTDGGLSSIAVCSLHGCYGRSLFIVVLLLTGFTAGLFRGAGKLLAVEYDVDEGFFQQRLILRTASTAAMFNTTGDMWDSSNGLFWILTPDGDVNPELLGVSVAQRE